MIILKSPKKPPKKTLWAIPYIVTHFLHTTAYNIFKFSNIFCHLATLLASCVSLFIFYHILLSMGSYMFYFLLNAKKLRKMLLSLWFFSINRHWLVQTSPKSIKFIQVTLQIEYKKPEDFI